jgi:hypothetical protein
MASEEAITAIVKAGADVLEDWGHRALAQDERRAFRKAVKRAVKDASDRSFPWESRRNPFSRGWQNIQAWRCRRRRSADVLLSQVSLISVAQVASSPREQPAARTLVKPLTELMTQTCLSASNVARRPEDWADIDCSRWGAMAGQGLYRFMLMDEKLEPFIAALDREERERAEHEMSARSTIHRGKVSRRTSRLSFLILFGLGAALILAIGLAVRLLFF